MSPARERRQRRDFAWRYPPAAQALAAAELRARIAVARQQLQNYPEVRSGTAREAPSTGMRDGTASSGVHTPAAASVGVQPAAPHHRDQTDWRERRRRLREEGHEVKQFEGRVLVDGKPSDDPGLYP